MSNDPYTLTIDPPERTDAFSMLCRWRAKWSVTNESGWSDGGTVLWITQKSTVSYARTEARRAARTHAESVAKSPIVETYYPQGDPDAQPRGTVGPIA